MDCFYLKAEAHGELKVSYRCISSHWFCFPIQFFFLLNDWSITSSLAADDPCDLWLEQPLTQESPLSQENPGHSVHEIIISPRSKVFSFTAHDVWRVCVCSRERTERQTVCRPEHDPIFCPSLFCFYCSFWFSHLSVCLFSNFLCCLLSFFL